MVIWGGDFFRIPENKKLHGYFFGVKFVLCYF